VGSDHTGDNQTSLDATVRFLREAEAPTLVFTNLVDFDMVYGHRRDPLGYARCLEDLDARLPEVVAELGAADWLLLTADHGCDPTAPGTDHTRELVPMVAFSPGGTSGARLADRSTFADLGATVADLFGVHPVGPGSSFAGSLAP
jgi:phosphopentomutase